MKVVVALCVQTVVVREVLASLPSGTGVLRLDDGLVVVTDDVDVSGGCCLLDGDRFHPVKSSLHAWFRADR